MCVCLNVFVNMPPGLVGASQTEEMRLHALTHKERGRAGIDPVKDK